MSIFGVLLGYVFSAQAVTRDVLFSAVSVYVLLAALFFPVFGSLEFLVPGSFIDVTTGQPIAWQGLVYFSQITLTSTGYGDIVSVSAWARSIASLEALTGVLYLAILISRLVSLYSRSEEANS